jgi:hypothetical protein
LATSLQSAPGVGFHLGLTSGYVAAPVFNTLPYENSTVAIKNIDDHIKDIISILGSLEYIALMQELTTNPNRLDFPPLNTIAQRLSFVWKALKRRINLLLGHPGSPSAATLSSMLKLRFETESRLSNFVTTIGIAFPNAALEPREEFDDALTMLDSASQTKTNGRFPTERWSLMQHMAPTASGCVPRIHALTNARKRKLLLGREIWFYI